MTQKITTFLMFEGKAEEAMNFYVSLFEDSGVKRIARYGAEGPGACIKSVASRERSKNLQKE